MLIDGVYSALLFLTAPVTGMCALATYCEKVTEKPQNLLEKI